MQKSVGFANRFKGMHPGVHIELLTAPFTPYFQLDIDLALIDKWALSFNETWIIDSNSYNNGIGFDVASAKHFNLLEERLCKGSSGVGTSSISKKSEFNCIWQFTRR